MTPDIAVVFSILAVAVVLLVTEWIPMEVTALLSLGAVALLGLVSPEEALAGFSSTAAVAIGSLFVLSYALTKTGLLETVAGRMGDGAKGRPWPMIGVAK